MAEEHLEESKTTPRTPGSLEAALRHGKGKYCYRCGRNTVQTKLESDHIIPRSWGGSDKKKNRRWSCIACHDYRHARDKILEELVKFVNYPYNTAQVTMWFFRLGVLEFYNTPEQIRERGSFMSYGHIPETMYSRWYAQIKVARRQTPKDVTLPDFVKGEGQQGL